MRVRACPRGPKHRRARALAIVALAVGLVGVAFPASAGAYVYWINWNQTTAQGSIGRANLDGTGANQNFITFPTGLEFEPRGVAVDGAHIYWGHGAIGRANIDGTGVDESFITAPHDAGAVAVDGSHIYWGYGNAISRADLDGTNISDHIAGGGVISVKGLAVYSSPASGGGHIFYADAANGEIGRANLDGARTTRTSSSRPVSGCSRNGRSMKGLRSTRPASTGHR